MILAFGVLTAACGGGGGGSSGGNLGSGGGGGGSSDPVTGGNHGGPVGKGTALVTWDGPTRNVDGSCLSDLESFRISYGDAPGNYNSYQTLDAESLSSIVSGEDGDCGEVRSYTYMLDDLGEATWYIAVQAVDKAGRLSEYSNEGIKTVVN